MNNRDPRAVRIKRRLGPLLNVPWVNAIRRVPMPDVSGEEAQITIGRMVLEGGRLIARVGETEGRAVVWRLTRRLARAGEGEPYEALNRQRLKLGAGYFPTHDAYIDRLADLYLKAISKIDLYAAWTPHDRLLCPNRAVKCRLVDLEPFFGAVRWTRTLAGKRVTIVSPFKETILTQWKKRDKLFAVETIPDCQLSVVQAPMTNCEANVEGQDWFANLSRLEQELEATSPEVAIIGAGAYGLPVGASAANSGATVVVMGGATQLLFGIMGNRWTIVPRYAALQNDHWVRPAVEERPAGFQNCETAGGAYW